MRRKALIAIPLIAVLGLAVLPAQADPKTRRLSVKTNGDEIDATSDGYIDGLSDDGKLAAFTSSGPLVAADGNGTDDVYLRNLRTDKTLRVSLEGDGASDGAAVSGNGKFVVFWSEADNLVPNDDDEDADIFIYNVETKNIQLVSKSANGTEVVDPGTQAAVNRSGRFVAFDTATQLVNKDNNHATDVYLRDRKQGTTKLVSVDSQGNDTAEGDSRDPSISANGRFIAFHSPAEDLIPTDENEETDVFRHDRRTGKTRRISVKSNGDEEPEPSSNASITADGSLIAFESHAQLVSMDANGFGDIYLRNVATGKTKLLTKDTSGEPSNEDSFYAAISPNGRLVGFYSNADDLIANDPPSDYSAYVLDRKSGKIKLVDRETSGAPGTERSYVIGISNSFVLFATMSALVGSDNNNLDDVYRRGPLT